MSGWRLSWKETHRPHGPPGLIDGSALRPDMLASLSLDSLREVKVPAGRRERLLTEVYDVEPLAGDGGPARLVVDGSPRLVRLGADMEGGVLDVTGDGGEWLGAEMRSGTIHVHGSAGKLAGAGMQGGILRIDGDAGDLLGGPLPGQTAGMRGGEIVVLGNAGAEAGLSMRRGLIAAAGSAGELPGHHLLAGTILVSRGELVLPGIEMRRGTIIGLESRGRPGEGFVRNGPVRQDWLRLLWRRLEELGFPIRGKAAEMLSGALPMESWSGDRLSIGRGEVLLPISESG